MRASVFIVGVWCALIVACAAERKVCDCPGRDGAAYVCGTDSQTYGNDCIRKCANIPLAYKGKCKDLKGCYPWGESSKQSPCLPATALNRHFTAPLTPSPAAARCRVQW